MSTGSVVTAGIHRAPSIKVAEAAKVIENTQRDLNIAFMNELSLIFRRARHRHRRRAGGGAHQMEFPAVSAGAGGRSLHRRRSVLPDLSRREGRLPSRGHSGRPAHQRRYGPAHRAECVRGLLRRKATGGVVTILGLTFKENVPDTRNSRVVDIVRELRSFGLTVQVHDPLADADDAKHEYGVT